MKQNIFILIIKMEIFYLISSSDIYIIQIKITTACLGSSPLMGLWKYFPKPKSFIPRSSYNALSIWWHCQIKDSVRVSIESSYPLIIITFPNSDLIHRKSMRGHYLINVCTKSHITNLRPSINGTYTFQGICVPKL